MESEGLVDLDIKAVEDILNSGDVNRVQQITQTREFHVLLAHKGSELIDSILSFLDDKNSYQCKALVTCYEEILKVTVENLDPNDSFITLLEHLDEETCILEKCMLLLSPIRISLQKMVGSRKNWLEWAMSTIQQYLDALSPPEDHQLDNDEKMLVEHPYLNSILALLKALFYFFEAFVDEHVSEREKDALIAFGMQILTKPSMYVYDEKIEKIQIFQTNMLDNIHKLSSNLYSYLEYLDEDRLSNMEKDELEKLKGTTEDEPLKLWDRISPLNLAVYYYTLIRECNFLQYFPHVYDILYLFHKLLFLCVVLLRHSHNAVARKGLHLSTRLLRSMVPGSVPYYYLRYRVHREFIKIISKICTHSPIYENRQEAVEILLFYVHLFDDQGTYMIYLNISLLTDNVEVDGEIINYFRKTWHVNYTSGNLKFYQKGKHFIDLLKSFCTVPDLKNADLVLHKSKILAVLSLIFLIMKRDVKKVTGVSDHFEYFERNFLSILAETMKKSRREFHQQLHRLKNDDPNQIVNEDLPVDVEVGGQCLPPVRLRQKIEAADSALSTLDMIAHALKLLFELTGRDSSELL